MDYECECGNDCLLCEECDLPECGCKCDISESEPEEESDVYEW